ncbi:MAG: PqqD family protein [Gemmatimonadaceae bacterium]
MPLNIPMERKAGVADKASITIDSSVVCSTSQISCDLADEAVILSLATGEYFGLNPVAARIWNLVQQPRRVADIRETLLAEYAGVSPEECTEQMLALLEEMVGLGLITVR